MKEGSSEWGDKTTVALDLLLELHSGYKGYILLFSPCLFDIFHKNETTVKSSFLCTCERKYFKPLDLAI